jgi:hypothetical protein
VNEGHLACPNQWAKLCAKKDFGKAGCPSLLIQGLKQGF